MHCCAGNACGAATTWINVNDDGKNLTATLCASCQRPLHRNSGCGRLWMADTLVCHGCFQALHHRKKQQERGQLEQRRGRKRPRDPDAQTGAKKASYNFVASMLSPNKRRRNDVSLVAASFGKESFTGQDTVDDNAAPSIRDTATSNKRRYTTFTRRARGAKATTQNTTAMDRRPPTASFSVWNQLQTMASGVVQTVTEKLAATAVASLSKSSRFREGSSVLARHGLSVATSSALEGTSQNNNNRPHTPLQTALKSPRYVIKMPPPAPPPQEAATATAAPPEPLK